MAEILKNTDNVKFDAHGLVPAVIQDDDDGEALMLALDVEGISVGTGSACATGTGEPSGRGGRSTCQRQPRTTTCAAMAASARMVSNR